ncbi:MAG: pyridoxamine 5'-phosphate oxidase family protein [Methylobacteriaceae bacterium]|nr:pyridoxamine 5'-phosphate oxidase family protein [Methylobacteriaceae bacterium]
MADTDADRAWELMEKLRFCMFSSWTGARIHSRPMGAFVAREENAIYFFTDVRAHKDEEIAKHPQVCLGFADSRGQKYVSVNGTAEVTPDRGKIHDLWSIPAKAWWKSPDDPNIRLIRVTPHEAEYWDSPGNIISSIKFAFAVATGSRPDAGQHEKVAL